MALLGCLGWAALVTLLGYGAVAIFDLPTDWSLGLGVLALTVLVYGFALWSDRGR